MSTPNTSLQTVPAESPAPAAPVAAPLVGRELMEQIIADNAAIQAAETSALAVAERGEIAPVTPVEAGTADLQYQTPEFVSEEYRAIEDWLIGAKHEDLQGAYYMGAACLNVVPEVIKHNRDYVLRVLGLSPEQAYRQVEAHNRAEYAASATLASDLDKLYIEYVEKGKAAGLNDLEAAGMAALAYQDFSRGYWQEGNAWRSAHDKWFGEIRSGYNLGPARDAFRKAFDAAFRRVVESHKNLPPSRAASAKAGLTGEDLMKDILRERGMA